MKSSHYRCIVGGGCHRVGGPSHFLQPKSHPRHVLEKAYVCHYSSIASWWCNPCDAKAAANTRKASMLLAVKGRWLYANQIMSKLWCGHTGNDAIIDFVPVRSVPGFSGGQCLSQIESDQGDFRRTIHNSNCSRNLALSPVIKLLT